MTAPTVCLLDLLKSFDLRRNFTGITWISKAFVCVTMAVRGDRRLGCLLHKNSCAVPFLLMPVPTTCLAREIGRHAELPPRGSFSQYFYRYMYRPICASDLIGCSNSPFGFNLTCLCLAGKVSSCSTNSWYDTPFVVISTLSLSPRNQLIHDVKWHFAIRWQVSRHAKLPRG